MITKKLIRKFTAFSSILMLLTTLILNFGNSYNEAFAQTTGQDQPDSIKFFNVNMPATTTVGRDFTLTGTIVSSAAQTLDHVYLTIQSSNQIFIYGDQTVDLGYFVGGNIEKNFSFKIKSLQSGSIQITLSAIGTVNNQGVQVKGSTIINSSAISTLNATQTSSQLAFIHISIPTNIISGNETTVNYTFVNKGSSAADDVIITLISPSGILVKGNPVNNIGKLSPGDAISSSFKLLALGSGSYNLQLAAYSSNNPTSTLPITLTVADSVANLAVTTVNTSPYLLYPGDTSDKINIGVTNFGQADLRGVTVRLQLPEGMSSALSGYNVLVFPYLPSAKNFPYPVQQFGTFFINIDKKIQPGTQIIGLSFSGSNLPSYSIQIPVIIAPKPFFELQNVTYSSSTLMGTQGQSSLSAGMTTVLRATLKNTGTASADSLIGTLQISNDFQGVRNTGIVNVGVIDRVGQILPNQVFHTTFTLDVDPTSQSGTYPATISLNWQQGQLTGNFTQNVPLSIPITTTPVLYSLPYLQIFLGGTSVLFLILYLFSRRKKKIDGGDLKTPI